MHDVVRQADLAGITWLVTFDPLDEALMFETVLLQAG
jgi:hypothetical protein